MATTFSPPCDETRGRAHQGHAISDKTGIIVATVLGSSLASIVGAIINVALPSMQAAFDMDAAGAQWVVNAYLLPVGALVLICGALGDHYGRKRMFVAGLCLFTIACLACALAPSVPLLLVARVFLGVGAAMMAPNTLSIIAAAFQGEERGKAVGTWAAAGAIAGAGAPLIGGWVVDTSSWRWAFALVLPFAVLTVFVALKYVEESKAETNDRAPLDWTGAALVTLALTVLIWAMIAAPERGVLNGMVLAATAAGFVLVALFLRVEKFKGDKAMMPLAVFSTSSFVGITVLTLLLYAALGGLIVLLPYMLITSFDYSASAAGAAILPFPLVIGTLSRATGGFATKIGLRVVLTVGPAAVAVGFVLLSLIPADDMNYWVHILPGMLIMAAGMAISVAPLTTAVMNSVSDEHVGTASGINNATSRIAGLIATAMLGPVLINAGAGDNALVNGFAVASLVGAGLALASAAASWVLIRVDQDSDGTA